ncbi:muconolactone delta-isomerase [Nocardioides immobilis]|uniref:Muconolactone delta-isomerase n=1 Tax=Nocardioides immobilis TaxID=2049295 RepID=A0A417Y6S0_9ACTN|nr:muconolactone Delta-isomerase family protein [Nocardioides immobilis]RHW28432.1 muconolactone delta-isomerase [Nocardioides immobilis]
MSSHEFLVHIRIAGVPPESLAALRAAEASQARALAAAGTLRRLWRLPEGWSNVGLWCAPDLAALEDVLQTLPLKPYMTVEIYPLDPHPNDPLPETEGRQLS